MYIVLKGVLCTYAQVKSESFLFSLLYGPTMLELQFLIEGARFRKAGCWTVLEQGAGLLLFFVIWVCR
jgi:hypothetical protein